VKDVLNAFCDLLAHPYIFTGLIFTFLIYLTSPKKSEDDEK